MMVFIDYQNVYMRAREVFGDATTKADFTFGQVLPRRLGVRVRQLAEEAGKQRTLDGVRVYRGEPDAERNPVGQAACQRQVHFWASQQGVEVFTRPLNYRAIRWDGGRPVDWEVREKGIDVMLAVDLVMGAARDQYDVAVLLSADTDLLPAAEAVLDMGKVGRVRCVATGHGIRLTSPNPWPVDLVSSPATPRLRDGLRSNGLHTSRLTGVA